MAENARLAYLQARLQARHGDRPSPDEWRVIEASADLSHYLDALRRTALKGWVADLNHEMEPELIERLLRAAWRGHVDQLAGWAPGEWRAAVEWLRWLPELPSLEHLLRDGTVAPWMRADPVMRELALGDPQGRREALAGSPLAPLAPPSPIVDAWLAAWRDRLPLKSREPDADLAELLTLIRKHVEEMRGANQADGRPLRSALATRVARRFRRNAGTATALFAHVVLDGLELERVRAGIMARRLMPGRVEGRSWA